MHLWMDAWMDGWKPPSVWSAVEVPSVAGCPALSINVLVVLHAEGSLGPAGGSCWAQTQAGAVQWGSRAALTSWLAGLQQQGHVCCRGCSEDGARMGPELHAATQCTVLSIHCTLAPGFYFMGVQVMEQRLGQGSGKHLSLQHPQLWGLQFFIRWGSVAPSWEQPGAVSHPSLHPASAPWSCCFLPWGGWWQGRGEPTPGPRAQHRSTQHILWRRCRNQLAGDVSAGLPRAGQLLSDPFPPQLAWRGGWLPLGAVWGAPCTPQPASSSLAGPWELQAIPAKQSREAAVVRGQPQARPCPLLASQERT